MKKFLTFKTSLYLFVFLSFCGCCVPGPKTHEKDKQKGTSQVAEVLEQTEEQLAIDEETTLKFLGRDLSSIRFALVMHHLVTEKIAESVSDLKKIECEPDFEEDAPYEIVNIGWVGDYNVNIGWVGDYNENKGKEFYGSVFIVFKLNERIHKASIHYPRATFTVSVGKRLFITPPLNSPEEEIEKSEEEEEILGLLEEDFNKIKFHLEMYYLQEDEPAESPRVFKQSGLYPDFPNNESYEVLDFNWRGGHDPNDRGRFRGTLFIIFSYKGKNYRATTSLPRIFMNPDAGEPIHISPSFE